MDRAMTGEAAEAGVEPVRFDGRTGEWFGIWSVNLLLSIVTLGIYSAWAKVRRNRYFYGNTTIGGRGFDYHATGGQILIGRLIVVGTFFAVGLISAALPLIVLLFYGAMVFVLPWLLLRATRFAARNTSWSNVRFDFQATYGQAFLTYVALPLGVALTLFTTLPFLTRRVQSFVVNGHRLGNRPFRFDAKIGGFYLAFGVALAVGAALMLVVGAVAFWIVSGLVTGVPADDPVAAVSPILAIYAALFLAVYPAAILYRAMIRNLVFAHATLEGGHRFRSTVRPAEASVDRHEQRRRGAGLRWAWRCPGRRSGWPATWRTIAR